VRVERQLEAAVAAEDFLDAARLRDELSALTPPPSAAPAVPARHASHSRLINISAADAPGGVEVMRRGVVVRIHAFHMPEHDSTRDESGTVVSAHTFGYKVCIVNNSTRVVQLIGRHWVIETLSGPESEVRGSGVVGRQPVLMPGESFEYTSACPLTCDLQQGVVPAKVIGSMRGEYQMVTGDTGTETFEVEIPRFYFTLPERIIEH
jgi:ApaG protein